MAKFLGPRFLLLVLAGVALCQSPQSSMQSNNNQTAAPESNSPGIDSSKPSPTQPPTTPPVKTTKSEQSSPEDTGNVTADTGDTQPAKGSTPLTTSLKTVTNENAKGHNNISGSPTSTPTQTNESSKAVTTTGSPASTPTQQHSSSATVSVAVNTTSGSPANTSTQQHSSSTAVNAAEKSNAGLSDSPRTNSTTNSPSPSPSLTTTTVGQPKCTYSLTKGTDRIEVKISTNGSETFKCTLQSTGHNIPEVPQKDKTFTILFKSLKPCQNYTVTVSPDCKPESDNDAFFLTTEIDYSDLIHKVNTNDTHVEVCFETKWNWKQCIPVNSSNSCAEREVTFQDAPCSKSKNFSFPPEKPVIDYKDEYPTNFTWKNPAHCKNDLKYSCNGSPVTDFKTNVKPIHQHNCKGTYVYENQNISSKHTRVQINCTVNAPSLKAVSHHTIEASLDIQSTNCPSITANFTWDVTCKHEKAQWENETTKIFKNLEIYTIYECKFTAMYENIIFNHTDMDIRTFPAEPTIKKHKLSKEQRGQNGFNVKCSIDKWNGEEGNFSAVLYINTDIPKKFGPQKTCDFTFDELYYLTEYKFEIYAQNSNGNISKALTGHYTTKYNDKAVLGILSFLIIITSLALLFVLYKIYLLKREKSRNEQELDDLLPTTALLQVEPMNAEALLEAYKKKRADEGRLFMEEFQSIPRIFSNYTVREAKKPENQPKNRYVDILPYDYNRVSLSHGGTDDYINASFIEGYKESNKYIAAQGPKEETVGEFWTMIWEQKSSIIVMVTRCEEGNKTKCAQYWPSLERETEIFEDLVVKIKGEEICPDYIIRHLTLMNRKEKSAEREVTHIQFTSWPDHGVPSDPGLLLKLRRRVNSFKNFFSGPIVTHCSAGVGRTGTYISIDAMIESLEAEGRVDIYGYVVKLRRQRCLMVQVEAQYVLIHTALIEYSQFGETEMLLSNFHLEVNILRQKEGNDPSLIEMEFQKLPKFKNYRSANTARSEENKDKNRSSIVPYDFNRVPIKVNDEASHDSEAEDEDEYSSDEDDEIPTKYINASYVDGYWSSGSFIAAQGPMADTVVDFLHMLYQKQVKSVFMLTDCTENEKEFCSQYWDDEKKTFGELEVEVKETENCPTYVKRCLEIQHTKRKDSHTLQQYHFLKWAGHELPPNPLDLVEMMRKVRQDSDTKNSDVPIVVHCNDGSSRSGVFCALWKLLDSADTEKLVDIFQVAKDLRKARLGVINSLEQYDFLYAALEAAYPIQNGEVKKPAEPTEDTVQVINESTALISPSTDTAPEEESPKESTDPPPPEEGATEAEASSEPEKTPSENTTNGPTTTIEV